MYWLSERPLFLAFGEAEQSVDILFTLINHARTLTTLFQACSSESALLLCLLPHLIQLLILWRRAHVRHLICRREWQLLTLLLRQLCLCAVLLVI